MLSLAIWKTAVGCGVILKITLKSLSKKNITFLFMHTFYLPIPLLCMFTGKTYPTIMVCAEQNHGFLFVVLLPQVCGDIKAKTLYNLYRVFDKSLSLKLYTLPQSFSVHGRHIFRSNRMNQWKKPRVVEITRKTLAGLSSCYDLLYYSLKDMLFIIQKNLTTSQARVGVYPIADARSHSIDRRNLGWS